MRWGDHEVESLSEFKETFQGCSSLTEVDIWGCSKLTSLCGGLEHLTALRSLSLERCDVLKLEEHGDDIFMPWRDLGSSLRSLKLVDLPKVEKLPIGMAHLTCLQDLRIERCDNFKKIPEWVGCLQSLQSLEIWGCPAITSLPDAMLKLTSLQKLHIRDCQGLEERCRMPNVQDWPKIKHIPLIKIGVIMRWGDDEVESLSEVEEMFRRCLREEHLLNIWGCSKLTSLCGGLEHLTALHSLSLMECDVLKLEEGEHGDDIGMPWRALQNNLRSLKLVGLPKVEELPMGMEYLTSLQHLHIERCDNLKEIPEWVDYLQSLQSLDIWNCNAITSLPRAMMWLTSLQKLHIRDCQGLEGRCRNPEGQDWPKIKHIPRIKLPWTRGFDTSTM